MLILLLALFIVYRTNKSIRTKKEALAAIEDIFLIYYDGRLIAHTTRRLKPAIDDHILSGMLTAIQNFVEDSFKLQEGKLNELQYGELKILLERGDKIYIAVVIKGEEPDNLMTYVKTGLERIEDKYSHVLEKWDGDYSKLRGIREYLEDLIIHTDEFNK